MKQIKKLQWKDNTTDLGKISGLIHLIAREPHTGINYIITNRLPGEVQSTNGKFFVAGIGPDKWAGDTEVDSLEKAKELAQTDFEDKIYHMFFE